MNIEEIKMDHFESFEELIKTCKMWIRDDDIDAYYRFFEFNCMKALLTAYEEKEERCNFLDKELYNANQEIQDLQLNIEKEKEKNKELEKKLDEISEINFPIIT